jgi:zinc/manganese transport system ATP-binding protein
LGVVTPIIFHHVRLKHGTRLVLSDLSGLLSAGSLTAVIGANGSGKTTLLRAMAGLHPVASGTIERGGLRAANIALLAQGSHLDRSFPITCQEVVALAGPRLGLLRSVGHDQLAAAHTALAKVGLAGFERRQIRALSAGQFQRVLFARTIVQDSSLILLDEPFTAVDADTVNVLLSVIANWHAQGRTVVAVLHDLELARRHFPQTLTLVDQHAIWTPESAAGLHRAA